MSKLVYVSGPLTQGDILVNTRKAIEMGDKLAGLGFCPVIPHLSIYWHFVYPHDYEFWMKQDFGLLDKCDALLRLPGHSPGSDREVEYAYSRGIFVGYSLKDVYSYFNPGELY